MELREAVQQVLKVQRDAMSVSAAEAAVADEPDEALGELVVAEYIVFLLALDTYIRWVEEATGQQDPTDDVIDRGIRLLRQADAELASIRAFFDASLTTPTHKKMLAKYLNLRATNSEGVGRRAWGLRTILSRGGAATMRAIFETNRALQEVRLAINASMLDDADAALDLFAKISFRNTRLRAWVDLAAKTAVPISTLPANVVEAGSKEAQDQKTEMLTQGVEQLAASGADASQQAQIAHTEKILQVQQEATAAARKSMDQAGEPDEPLTKSETVGVAVAAATAAVSDPSNPSNIPVPLRKLDDEQRAAALTDGRVLVAAGAGAGKSTALVARVRYLLEDRRVNPSRVLVTSFNKKAANELAEKITTTTGLDLAQSGMLVGTTHSLFRAFITDNGDPDEQGAMSSKQPSGFVGDGSVVARAVQKIWEECFDSRVRPTPKLKAMKLHKSLWAGNDISPAQARTLAKTKEEVDAADWYEMYEGLKGGIPGWQPPCEAKAKDRAEEEYQERLRAWRNKGSNPRYRPNKPGTTYEAFMAKTRKGGMRLGDFEDMIKWFRDILKRNPGARKEIQKRFDHILVDECQDLNSTQHEAFALMTEHVTDGSDGKSLWMVGDDKQCPSVDTEIDTPEGRVLAKELNTGDLVLSYRNGRLQPQPVKVTRSEWTWGYRIRTACGRSLLMSPNHKIWATPPVIEESQVAVYMMFRPDMGFRVGVTNKGRAGAGYLGSFAGRAFQEKAERMWIIRICNSREEALLEEMSLALTYGIPTCVFNGEHRGLNQERLDEMFRRFGRRGVGLLEDRHLSFDLPHWMSSGYAKHGRDRRVVHMKAHTAARAGSLVCFEWTPAPDDGFSDQLRSQACLTQTGRLRIRKASTNYRESLEIAQSIARKAGAALDRTLTTLEEGDLPLVTAGSLFPGMCVSVWDAGTETLELDTIVSVDREEGEFIGLDVADASNFFGGGILSHNSIYAFRGARPDLFTGLHEKEGWKTRMIKTNYRCEPEIVEVANKLIAHNEGQIPMDARPAPTRAKGVGSIRLETPPDDATAAIDAVERIKSGSVGLDDVGKTQFYAKNAVLARTNAELHSFETACIIRGVPYARKGSGSFLGAPETEAVLGYVELIMGADAEAMQKAFGKILNRPNRFWLAPKDSEEIVKDAIREYARYAGSTIKSINPVSALRDSRFQEILAEAIVRKKGKGSSYGYSRDLSKMSGELDEIQAMTSEPGFTTENLFNAILALKGKGQKINPDTGRSEFVDQSFREALQLYLRDKDTGEDDEEEEGTEEALLGNISFLYKLAEVDPTDEADQQNPPTTPNGFQAKIDRFRRMADDLRIDLNEWEKKNPGKPPPAVYLGTVHCSPADEPVLTTDGWVPIGDLDPQKHRLASYAPSCNQLFWGRVKGAHEGPDGYGFQKGSRFYKGPLLTLTTKQSKTRVTPDHKIRVKFAETFFNKHVVYLMRRGEWWRVGHCKSAPRPYKAGDLSSRLATEKADAGWILRVCDTKEEAILEESRIQAFYGIPGATFESNTNRVIKAHQLHAMHESVKHRVAPRAEALLFEFGLDKAHPLYLGGPDRECDKRESFTIQARNFLNGYMLLPVVSQAFIDGTGPREVWTKPEWHEVEVTRADFEGDVYSLVVFPHHFYVSGGAVVHNSVKGAQWQNCFVQMPKGKFPIEKQKKDSEEGVLPSPEELEKEQQERESERRLAYVALTRAAVNLTVICPAVVGGRKAGVSQFADEAGLTLGENVQKPNAGGAVPELPTDPTVKEASIDFSEGPYEAAGEAPWNPEA